MMHPNAVKVALGLLAGLPMLAPRTFGAQDPRPSFEVVSVRVSGPEVRPDARLAGSGYKGDTFRMTGATLGAIVRFAYGIDPLSDRPFATLEGEPDWKERFDIIAKTSGPVAVSRAVGPLHYMVQSLLEERFRLRVHWETREGPVYALTRARGDGALGPQMRRSSVDCDLEAERRKPAIAAGTVPRPVLGAPRQKPTCGVSAGPLRQDGKDVPSTKEVLVGAQPIAALLTVLARDVDRPIVDRTGLEGAFDVELRYSPPSRTAGAVDSGRVPVASEPSGPSLGEALRDQLGLQLESTRGPLPVLVIDSVQLPAEN